jgi:radical SAM superfamily enzyme YgiQ (UPF0313 family)
MAQVILFSDNVPNNIGTDENPLYINYQTRAAGVYAIASHLRRSGYTVKVIEHISSLTFVGIKKIIQDNSQDLLWVGLGTTFFNFKGTGLPKYREAWATSNDLYFNNTILEFIEAQSATNFLNTATELIWSSNEINIIAKWCYNKFKIPVLIGGAWVSGITQGNLTNLEPNVHIIPGRGESIALKITEILDRDPTSELPLFVNNDHYDNIDFKRHGYQWEHSDQVTADEWLPVEVSRGCAFNCAYCNYDRKSSFDNYKNPKTLRDELIKNYEKFGVTKYILADDLYNDSKDKVRRLYDEVWSKLPFKPEWASYLRLDMFWADPESIEIVKASGARAGNFGIETLHNVAGKKVGKGLGKERIIETLTQLKDNWRDDVIISACFIAGLPDEPEESILETIKWCSETKLLDSVKWSPLWITPPDHKKFVLKTHRITDDNEKYGITWLDDNIWINKQGITFRRANELATIANKNKFSVGGFGYYIEFRQLGWSHEKIVKYVRNTDDRDFLEDFNNSNFTTTNKINDVIKKNLNL